MKFLEVTKEDKAFVRKQLGLKEGDIKRDVEILKEWMKKQPHLPQGIQDDSFFERFIIGNKGMVEESEQCIDNYYTAKTIWPKLYQDLHKLRPSDLSLDLVPATKLGKDKEIIILAKYHINTGDVFDILKLVKVFFAELEILSKLDCCSGIRILVDLTDFRYDMVKLLTPALMQKFLTFISSVYSYKLFGIHYLKAPAWIDEVMNMFKTIVKPEIMDKITFHDDLDSLTEKIPLEFLPKDYGGNQPSFKELNGKWDKIFEDEKEFLQTVPKLKSDEKLRVGMCRFDTHVFGTLKKLNVD